MYTDMGPPVLSPIQKDQVMLVSLNQSAIRGDLLVWNLAVFNVKLIFFPRGLQQNKRLFIFLLRVCTHSSNFPKSFLCFSIFFIGKKPNVFIDKSIDKSKLAYRPAARLHGRFDPSGLALARFACARFNLLCAHKNFGKKMCLNRLEIL